MDFARSLPAPSKRAVFTEVVPTSKARYMTASYRRGGAAGRADSRELWRRCPTEPGLVLSARELELLRDVRGRRACVLGSGDNQVVFALAGLGARVTSVD